jgi:N-methylhydantoinase B
MQISKDTLITHEQAGGGGYGDPKNRDSLLVREDIADGKISEAFAREHYGA